MISNKQVQFRAAERILIEGSDYYTRIHRATGDCQNPVERTQAAVGKAFGNGDRIHWEYRKMFDGLEEHEKEKMSLEEFAQYEEDRQKYNVVETCKDLAARVQDAPGPKGTLNPMTSMVSQPTENLFFGDSQYLTNYINASASNRTKLPGFSYYQKLDKFYQLHFQQGELYMEYIKDDCLKNGNDEKCSFCKENPWKATKITRVPRAKPMVDSPNFLPLNDTPVYEDIDLLSWRKPDDFQPRAQLRKLFNSKDISTKSKENIDEFCKQFAVDRRLVIEQLQHFEYLEYKKQKRSTKKQVEQAAKKLNTYDDIEWQVIYRTETEDA